MNSRERILSAIKTNQPAASALPGLDGFPYEPGGMPAKFISILEAIGGKAHVVKGYTEIREIIKTTFSNAKRIVSTCAEFNEMEKVNGSDDPHLLEDIDLAIVKATLGVAENAAIWLTEDMIPHRVLPFICQYLAAVIHKADIVPTMHHAYEKIGNSGYGFGTFIAGPSKTADIEQSLVLGAHGPKGMTVFVIDEEL